MALPPKTVILRLLSYSSKKNSKKFKKNALDTITVLFQDKSITIDIVPQLKFFCTFHGVSHLFAKAKVRKDHTQIGISFVVNL